MLNMVYKNNWIHLKGYVLSAWNTSNLWQSLITWLTASDEILELAFDTHIISSEYGLKHNLRQIKKFVCLRLAYCLCIEYEL